MAARQHPRNLTAGPSLGLRTEFAEVFSRLKNSIADESTEHYRGMGIP